MAISNISDEVDPLRLAWLLRADLRGGQPVDAPLTDGFRCWWVINGRREYPAWSHLVDAQALDLLTPLPGWPRYGRFGMTRALRFLFDQREDLGQVFDTSTQQGLWHAIAWQFTYGLREHGLMDLVDTATLAALDETPAFLVLPVPSDQLPPPQLTWLMFFVWRCGPNLQKAFDLRTPQGQAGYLQWFLFEGVPSLGLGPLVSARWRAWLRKPLALKSQPEIGVPRAALLLWQRRPEMRKAFDLNQPADWAALGEWARKAWQGDKGLRWVTQEPPQPPAQLAPEPEVTNSWRPFGLNLIGFAFGELGIGEDVRMAVAACEAAGIPFKVVNIYPGKQLRQADRSLADYVDEDESGKEDTPYAINVFCLTGFDTVRVFLERGTELFKGRYNIGWWPWELPVWPGDWQPAFEVVDEVWAATNFTHRMYTQAQQIAKAPVPVTLMPLPASVTRVKKMSRRQLGLPNKRFLFLYAFDFNSYLARKNPFAAIKAFRQAFAADDESVGLVLKAMNSQTENPVWKRFVRECAADPRIVLFDRTLDRPEVLGLIQACDAYLSLHRSEGFGRTLAEAMLFGKPVVGTNFSGNVDFLTEKTGFPVMWKRKNVRQGEYPFITGADKAWWAEPDLDDAVKQLKAARRIAKNKAFSTRVKRLAEEQFSPRYVARLMRERLDVVYTGLNQ